MRSSKRIDWKPPRTLEVTLVSRSRASGLGKNQESVGTSPSRLASRLFHCDGPRCQAFESSTRCVLVRSDTTNYQVEPHFGSRPVA